MKAGGVKDQWAEVLNTCAVMTLRSAYLHFVYMHVMGCSHWQSPCKFLIEIATSNAVGNKKCFAYQRTLKFVE